VATFPLTVLELANAGGVPVGVAVVISSLGVASPALGYVSPGDSIFHQLMSNATPAGVGANPLSPVIVAPMLRANSGGQLGNLWMVAQ
jgi:hypothetical protein